MGNLLEIRNLSVSFDTPEGEIQAVRNVSFALREGEILAIVGESGCGKSVLCKSILKLLPDIARIKQGQILLENTDITRYRDADMRRLRGRVFSMVLQDPMTALNPLLTIGRQMTEGLIRHLGLTKKEAHQTAVSYLEKVGIANPEDRMRQYPFQLSGGLRQRVMIAMVMAVRPSLLIADEPTTALDVTIQKQVLVLLNKLKKDVSTGVLFITHDLGVVAEIADRVIILYSGRKVEEGPIHNIFARPLHPYTIGLMKAVPNVDEDDFDIQPIPGVFPNITEEIGGCRFHPRCPYATQRCRQEIPAELTVEPGHTVCCHKVAEELSGKEVRA